MTTLKLRILKAPNFCREVGFPRLLSDFRDFPHHHVHTTPINAGNR
jgi:hypothetical protein